MKKTGITSIPIMYGMRNHEGYEDYGEYMNYPWARGRDVTWIDNVPFEDTMVFVGFDRGRSAAHAVFRSDEKKMFYTVFLIDLGTMMQGGMFDVGGVVKGTFIGCKRGSNYGVRLHEGS